MKPTLTDRKCAVCGSPLLLIETKTEKLEGSLFPQTTSIYHCSDETCQAEKDKQTAKRLEQVKAKADADKKRDAAKLAGKAALKI